MLNALNYLFLDELISVSDRMYFIAAVTLIVILSVCLYRGLSRHFRRPALSSAILLSVHPSTIDDRPNDDVRLLRQISARRMRGFDCSQSATSDLVFRHCIADCVAFMLFLIQLSTVNIIITSLSGDT